MKLLFLRESYGHTSHEDDNEAGGRHVTNRFHLINHKRYQQEVEMGLHDKKRSKKSSTKQGICFAPGIKK